MVDCLGDWVIIVLYVLGDFVDLYGFVLVGLEYEVVLMGVFEVEFVEYDELCEIIENFLYLICLLWMFIVIDVVIYW